MQKENMLYKKDRLRLDMQVYQKRVDDLSKEMTRIRGHKGKLIDTDVWIPGVMQRCLTRELKKHLRQEYAKADALSVATSTEVDAVRAQIFDLSDLMAQVKRDQNKITKAIKVFYRTFRKFQATSVEDLAKHMLTLQAKADQLEARRQKETDVEKVFAGGTSSLNALLDKVRLKESEIRTKDERQFVGIDLIMNPDQYLHLSTIEAEQMAFDEDYQCHLSRPDLERIMKLPEAINLALPFLHTAEEINAHRLVNMFYRQRDDTYFQHLDFLTYDRFAMVSHGTDVDENGSLVGGGPSLAGASVAGESMSIMEELSMSIMTGSLTQQQQQSSKDKKGKGGNGGGLVMMKGDLMGKMMASMRSPEQDAEVVHDILVKESLRDRLRHIFEDEMAHGLTEDERKWLVLDRILAPYVYGLADEEVEEERRQRAEKKKQRQQQQEEASRTYTQKMMAQKQEEKKGLQDDLKLVESLNTSLTRAGNKYNTQKANLAMTSGGGQQGHPSEGREGDVYEPLRQTYENDDVDDLFNYGWHCPFSRAELENLYHTPMLVLQEQYAPVTNEDGFEVTSTADRQFVERLFEVKRLLEKYHVSEAESLLGNAKISLLSEVNNQVITAIQKEDALAVQEQANLRRLHAQEVRQQQKQRLASQTFSAQVFAEAQEAAEGSDNENDDSHVDNQATKSVVPGLAGIPAAQAQHAAVVRLQAQEGVGGGGGGGTARSVSTVDSNLTNDLHQASLQSGKQRANEYTNGDEEDFELRRVWGSWNHVHPASQGKESQKSFFLRATFNAARDHPAAYAIHEDEEGAGLGDSDEDSNGAGLSDEDSVSLLTQQKDIPSPRTRGVKTLLGEDDNPSSSLLGTKSKKVKKAKKARDVYFICETMADLAVLEPRRVRGKIVLLQETEPMSLFSIKDNSIQARQSRSHYFTIPDREQMRVLEMTVSVVFQGTFSTVGYKLGRLAAGLFRLPDVQSGTAGAGATATQGTPIPIGFTLHSQVSPNLPQSLGKIVISHKPRVRPIAPGNFQLIIGAAANSKYSVEVTAKYARAALPVVDSAIERAKTMQTRLPKVLLELDMIAESLRLTERKLLVCEKLITEAELETERAHSTVQRLQEKLEQDDEDLNMLEDERRELQREMAIQEVEYAQWSGLFASRCKEKEDIKEGIQMMNNFRRQREEERAQSTEELEALRRDVPACIRLLRTMTEAVQVAMSLNTVFQGMAGGEGDGNNLGAGGGMEQMMLQTSSATNGIQVSTPAADVRRTMKQYGFQVLSLEQQQWSLLDQKLNPTMYEPWLREQLEADLQEAISMGKITGGHQNSIDDYYRSIPALEPFL